MIYIYISYPYNIYKPSSDCLHTIYMRSLYSLYTIYVLSIYCLYSEHKNKKHNHETSDNALMKKPGLLPHLDAQKSNPQDAQAGW